MSRALAPDAEIGDQGLVPLKIRLLQVIEETAPLGHNPQQAAPAVVILVILLEMGLKIEDPCRHERNLRFRATRVTRVTLVFLEDRLTLNLSNRHFLTPSHAILPPQPRHGAAEGDALYGSPTDPAMKNTQVTHSTMPQRRKRNAGCSVPMNL